MKHNKYFSFSIICYLFFHIIIYPMNSWASGEFLFPGTRSTGLGGAYTAIDQDLEALGYNPAGLKNLKKFNIFSSTKKLYEIDGLRHTVLGFGYGTEKNGVIGLMYEDLGYSLHTEKTITVGYGRNINRFMGIGANIKLYSIDISGFGSDNAVGIDLGYQARIFENVQIGVNAKNINNPKIGSSIKKELNKSITGGLSYINDFLILSVDAAKETDYKVQLRTGVELKIFEIISLRCGYNNEPSRWFYGLGVNVKKISFSYSQYNHPYLNDTKQFGISIIF